MIGSVSSRSFVVLLLALCAVTAYAGDGKVHRVAEKVPNRYIVIMASGHLADEVAPEFEQRHGGNVKAVMRRLNTFSITLPNEAAAEAISRDPRVAHVQEDGIVHAARCCRRLDSNGSQWSLSYVNWTYSFESRFDDSPGGSLSSVRVYVIDTAINSALLDFQIWTGGSKVNEVVRTVGPDPYYCYGGGEIGRIHKVSSIADHGTAVASILAGNTNGVVPEISSIVSIVALDCTGAGTDTSIQQAADYAIATHTPGKPAVANVSLYAKNGDTILDYSIQRMVDNGIFVAGAAGNDLGADACTTSPARLGGAARYPGFLVAGALNIYGNMASYSDVGPCVDIWAPGGETNMYDANDRGVMSAVGPVVGTSFAAPHVAAAAVLIYSQYPTWGPADVAAQIKYLNSTMVQGHRTLVIPHCDMGRWGCPVPN
jgi:subtilisin family serine protease